MGTTGIAYLLIALAILPRNLPPLSLRRWRAVQPSIEDKAAHLLYFLVKDHPFVDGCKRIAATLFLEFLNRNHLLIRDNELAISNNTLVAITLLTAESKPEDIDTIINVIMHLLIEKRD